MPRKVEMPKPAGPKAIHTIFITGTGTGVGKTVLTALLLAHLRSTEACAVALKPFCSGSRGDAQVLHSLQDGELDLDEINPFFFEKPLAPYVAACLSRGRKDKRRQGVNSPSLAKVVTWMNYICRHKLRAMALKSGTSAQVLVEGSGGVLVPLGKDFSVLEVISTLAGRVIVVAPNTLGTLNHSLLTVRTLRQEGLKHISLVLMDCKKPDLSSRSNAAVLSKLLGRVPIHSLPFLGRHCRTPDHFFSHAAKLRRVLDEILSGEKSQ